MSFELNFKRSSKIYVALRQTFILNSSKIKLLRNLVLKCQTICLKNKKNI